MCPKPLVLAFEMGTNAKANTYVQPIETWSDFKKVLKQLDNPQIKEKFQTIGVDTVSIAYSLCEQFICAQAGVQKIGDIPYGGGYNALSKEFEASLRRITMMGYGLTMTCHLKIVQDEEGRILGAKPDLNDRALKIVNGLVDIIGVITQEWNANGESERYIITHATKDINAGSRFKYLPERIPFSYVALERAVGEAIEREAAENNGTVVDHYEYNTSEKLNFADVRAEAQKLWTSLVEANEENADIILKKIEIAMGRSMRLSEFTEDQVVLLQDIVEEMRKMAQ